MKTIRNQRGYSAAMIGLAVIVIAAVAFTVIYVAKSHDKKPSGSSTTTKTTTATTDNYQMAPLKTYANDKYGITLKVPSDWTEDKADPEAAILKGQDKASNVEITLYISKETQQTLSCSQVIMDSADLTYDDPIPGQRKTTKLTFTSIDIASNTLCGVMITGSFSAKKGDVINVTDQAFQSSLPTNRIVAYVSNLDSSTNYPKLDTALASHKYAELIAALKSIQVK